MSACGRCCALRSGRDDMPRPAKARLVCELPQVNEFVPVHAQPSWCDAVFMTVDEYETIFLIDYQGLTQEECAKSMGVARTSIQSAYRKARLKMATCLAEGRSLVIAGGDYKVCPGDRLDCRRECCCRKSSSRANVVTPQMD